jgi:hypothetical protein
MREALMAIGWLTGGVFLSALIVPCKIDPPCPKLSIKCWIGGFVSVAFGFGYYLVMGMKDGFGSIDYLVSFIVASVVGAAVARIICPL